MYVPEQSFVHPTIVDISRNVVIEDLPKHLIDGISTDFTSFPLLLCGSAGTGKSTILRILTFSAVESNRFGLVLYLENMYRQPKLKNIPLVTSSSDFWEQVFNCVKFLAAKTVQNYGFESVAAVIRENIDKILFIVDWNMKSMGNIFKEMQHGTWIAAHQEVLSHTNNWKVLEIKPFTEHHVLQLLQKSSGGREGDVIRLYKQSECKHLISTPDMVEVFRTHGSTVQFGTDFELIAAFVNTKLRNSGWTLSEKLPDILKLGEVATSVLVTGDTSAYDERVVSQIDGAVKDMFLCTQNRETKFKHSSVQDFIAALYVFHCPGKACKKWKTCAPSFKNVFKFVCGMWCNSGFWSDSCTLSDERVTFMEEYLTSLFDIKSWKHCKGNREAKPMEVEETRNERQGKQKAKIVNSGNPLKCALAQWDYLIALDDVCQGDPRVINLFVKLLSSTQCWIFDVGKFDDRKLTRIVVLLKKVKLNEDYPLTIKLESTPDVRMLIKMWNKLKNIQSLQNCTHVKFYITKGSCFPYTNQNALRELCKTLVNAHCSVFITSFRGPLLCSTTLEFLKGHSLKNLDTVDVIVYEVSSLIEILKCDHLPNLKYISVTVELTNEEQLLTSLMPFHIPSHQSLKLRIKYFDNIQKFLDKAQCPGNLKSLSIYDVYITVNFSLNLLAFESIENLSLRFQPYVMDQVESQNQFVDEHFKQKLVSEVMDVDESNMVDQNYKIPRRGWMLAITVKVKYPPKLERLLLRNMDFYGDSNNNLLLNIFKNYNIQKLIILDSQLSLRGVRKVLSSHTSDGDEVHVVTKKLRNNKLEMDYNEELLKRPRLSNDEREQKKIEKPKGKEIVITSEIELCKSCCLFPCLCTDSDLNRRENFDDLVNLIKDVYLYDIVSFNYASKVITIRKDVCGDLRVQCALPGLMDETSKNLSSDHSLFQRFFKILALAQNICLEQTQLSFQGVKDVVDYLKTVKQACLDPFSLTIISSYHPCDEEVTFTFMETIKRERIFTTFNFWCSCENKCFKIKKTFNGKMLYNDQVQEGL
ncbi:uncharacterized protein [Palaemon carinicauda]